MPLLTIAVACLFMACEELLDEPPEGHTINKGGVWHMPGLEAPGLNCVECHGESLDGGSSGVSCYECHSKLP